MPQAAASKGKPWLRRGLEAKRKTGGDENHGVTRLRQRLIEQALRIPEGPCERVFGDDAAAHLVGYKNHRAFEPRDALREIARRGGEIRVMQKKLAKPERQAINDNDTILAGLAQKGLSERDGFFYKRPACIPRTCVAGDAPGHLAVCRLCRGKQDGMTAGGFGESLRIGTLARSRAAKDKKRFRQDFEAFHSLGPSAPRLGRSGSGAPGMRRQIADADRGDARQRDFMIVFNGAPADADRTNEDSVFIDNRQAARKCNQPVV